MQPTFFIDFHMLSILMQLMLDHVVIDANGLIIWDVGSYVIDANGLV
jgi:hypothetical protein